MLIKTIALVALVLIVVRLGLLIHQRSVQRQPIHGGAISLFFNLLSAICFVAILPTVCMSVLVLHPETLELAGIVWNPILLIVITLTLASLIFAALHALVERAQLQCAEREKAAQETRGWTEEDAKTSGL